MAEHGLKSLVVYGATGRGTGLAQLPPITRELH